MTNNLMTKCVMIKHAMRRNAILNSAHAFILILLLSVCAAAQTETSRRQLIVPLPGAGFVGFRLEATGDGATNLDEVQAALVPQALLDEDHTIHRVLVDREGNFVFGYDLVFELLTPARQFKVYARPLSAAFSQQLRARTRTTQPAPAFATLPRPASRANSGRRRRLRARSAR